MITLTVLLQIVGLAIVLIWIYNWIENKVEESAERRRGEEARQDALRKYQEAQKANLVREAAYAAYAATYLREIEDFSLRNKNLQKTTDKNNLVLVQVSAASIENIREFRELTDYGLKEAKEVIDAVQAGGTWVYPGKDLPDVSGYKHLKFERR